MAIDTYVQQKLKQLREEQKYTLEQLARKLDTTSITLSRYETGKRSVSLCILEEICKVYHLTISDFFNNQKAGLPTNNPVSSTVSTSNIFIYGEISAGAFLAANEDYIAEIEIPSSLSKKHGRANLFGLVVKGNSMNKIVQNQDYVILNKQQTANNGDVVAVLVNGEDATLKRFYQLDNETLILKPESNDAQYQPITIDLRDPNISIEILGKLVWHCSSVYN
ncbi:MAG: LexA family protein [Culicoidibacterales bacterium]